ncbi:MAG: hypothetical protein A2381_12175 [Bdellovibrionales bacterium RIFOXYB1_FULL_37_110]|nr:MAG: hypothetical protein A2181_01895 [Bdellovibrionales bacterium RIFOXYA1_FULL_38_20]OFZ52252.1 MAG: hypothetical protein A2417_06015 [Bdellovibrionales bacterium RIFOXYC1_FULL_37_79]OFZ57239.1 MAG: hypothetical protein A2381_12175 [Bdellovibrionales bacterium RIFOXYB1_FULL_37_110]OFZ65241.1 MAG: hypothetical protein A2577_04610 [Bdellovibrionales bacterium RIFOXYD1_FULL_36_51]
MKKYLLIVIMYSLSSVTFGYYSHRYCNNLVLHTKILSFKSHFTSDKCAQTTPLALAQGDYTFSFGTHVARYWVGGYSRPAESVTRTLYKWYTCWGDLFEQKIETKTTEHFVSFDLINTNLSSDATWADVKAPMTDEEAKTALIEAKQRCERADQDALN